ncbi:MAG: hypothetical protein Q9203_000909 [Teloschistes exilis]
MSASSFLSLSRRSNSNPVLRSSYRGYSWSKGYKSSYDSYLTCVKRFRTICNSPHLSEARQLVHSGLKKEPSGLYRTHLPYKGWRLSSSWGKWYSKLDDLDSSPRPRREDEQEHSLAWNRSLEKLEKEAAELYEIFKKRIDSDPFDALFGHSLLYPRPAARPSAEKEIPKEQSGDGARPSGNEFANRPAAPTSDNMAANNCRTLGQEYDIDPITMRKVPRNPTSNSANVTKSPNKSDETVEVPVKPFSGAIAPTSSDQSSKNAPEPRSDPARGEKSEESSGWLVQEGFASEKQSLMGSGVDKVKSISRSSPPVENALGRSARLEPSNPDAKSELSYEPREIQTDDVDLLRTSDVRASSGFAAKHSKESETQKQQRRNTLEARFEASGKGTLELQWMKELAAKRKERREVHLKKQRELRSEYLQKEVQAQKAAMEAMRMRRASRLSTSVDESVAHPEQGEGDMASNVHEFASRDRWYKRKAPHAAGTEEQMAIQSAKDRSLIREIRGIYEDTYGIIDTKHRQTGTRTPTPGPPESTKGAAASPLTSQENRVQRPADGEQRNPQSQEPLSVREKIATLLEQFTDDSRSMQKLLGAPELTSQIREEIFHRNRSMRNASDGIFEALSSNPPKVSKESVQQAIQATKPSIAVDSQKQSDPVPSSTDISKPCTVYSVLAYDPSIQQVTTADMSSPGESSSERRLSLSEALSSLTDPAKFLPHLTTLQSQGYEIVSSDTNILVLRKVHKAPLPSACPSVAHEEETEKAERRRSINPIDGTTTQTGNFASPTGFVGEAVLPPQEMEGDEAVRKPSGHKVRREEDVFSGGSGNVWDHCRPYNKADRMRRKAKYRRAGERRRTTKRMVMAGLWTAGLCYFIGVATEFLRA